MITSVSEASRMSTLRDVTLRVQSSISRKTLVSTQRRSKMARVLRSSKTVLTDARTAKPSITLSNEAVSLRWDPRVR
ncbi:hypothetical protein BD311DRAFT_223087 [Dichomitus squalens]|uniref:Uncharacterized protein n=1 Tax=Dichomitus squalens TaxID=114155 RepID=A0A4Q9MRC6_9APHY|nr:hypothetical protein BD311DRAFT_223087 [Dichomitus squalens]